MKMLWLQRARIVAALGVAMLGVGRSAAQAPAAGAGTEASERARADVEAAYLWNFARLMRWPTPPDNNKRDICLAGRRLSLEALKKMVSGQHVDGILLVARNVEKLEDLESCDILFVAAQDHDADAFLEAVEGKPILTVSDAGGFLERGGMVQFAMMDGRVRFMVNLTAVGKSHLELSSDLLKVAVKVTGNTGEGGGL